MAGKKSVFEFLNYKDYLRSQFGGKSERRGLKTALAKAIGCGPTYISQILNEFAHLSSEQATDVSTFLGHTRDEAHFFLLLLSRDRAGNQTLKKYYGEQIQEVLDRRLNLAKRLGEQNVLDEESKVIFYSSWHYAAIHLALTVPELQTREVLAKYFRLPMKKVISVLEFLVSVGLARTEGERFVAGSTVIRIGSESPHIVKHHSHWRAQAIESLDRDDIVDLHYSAVVSLSRADARAIKERVLENIKEYLQTIRESREEEVYALCMDFFSLRRE